jgi:hypothetical protein
MGVRETRDPPAEGASAQAIRRHLLGRDAPLAYPFFSSIYLSLQDKMVGAAGHFVGFQNYLTLLGDPVFRKTAINTFIYTAS